LKQAGCRDLQHKSLDNLPDWLLILRIDGGDWFDPNKAEIVDCYRNLDFRNGILHRVITVKDSDGKETLIQSWRLASMNDPHLAALKYTISPINYKGKITVRSTLNGNIINDGVDRYRQLNQKHLQSHNAGAENNICWLVTKTSQSGIQIAQAVRCDVFLENKRVLTTEESIIDKSEIHMLFSTQIKTFQVFTVEKVAAIYTSKHDDSPNPLEDAKAKISETISFNQLVKDSKAEWKKIWSLIDINIQGDRLAQKLLRLHLYHLMVSFSPHNQHFDASITARGLHGEAYRGHIFWDELFILPLYAMHFPEAARSMLMYRYRRLGKAREYAIEHGYKGAMFPWQSGSDGREETQIIHLNPVSGKWGDDYSSLQRHVSLAIAFNIWNYLKITGDINFLRDYGAEMFFEICRFWASMVEKDRDGGRYSIKNVMGPDEFHEAYPNSTEGGLKDNSYTNLMVAWMMSKAPDLLELLKPDDQALIKSKLLLNDKELTKWEDISTKINIVVQNGIIAQYDGYFDLKELDWDFYKKKYGNVHRMDRLLKAEGKSADEYKVAKQADTIMTFYNLTEEEVTQILKRLGYCLAEDYLKRNLDYYLGRTSHGSTLSRVVHAYVSNKVGNKVDSWKLYKEALISDFTDIQGGTTGEGIHTGVMAGTVLVALRSFAGVDIKNGMLYISPNMPEHWEEIRFNIGLSSDRIFFNVTAKKIELKMEGVSEKILVKIKGENYNLFKEQKLIITF
jgi:trehalose/maltose hydrolase-like predicted phosphorylase